MAPEYLLQQLLKHGERMRDLQVRYFQEKNVATKHELLQQSKAAEHQFDILLEECKKVLKHTS